MQLYCTPLKYKNLYSQMESYIIKVLQQAVLTFKKLLLYILVIYITYILVLKTIKNPTQALIRVIIHHFIFIHHINSSDIY